MEPAADRTRPFTVRQVVRDVVVLTAPEEAPLLEALDREPDDGRVVRVLSRRPRRGEPLGFGLEQAVPLLTPVVWLSLDEAVRHGAGAATDGIGRRARLLLARVFRRRGKAPAVQRTVPPLTREQLAAVRERVVQRARAAGVAARRAEAVADAVVARLVLDLGATETAGERGEPGPAPR